MILNGRLDDWSVGDLLQIVRITNKTAALEIDGDAVHGVLFFEDGQLVDASLDPGASDLSTRERIVETVYVLGRLDGGTFEMVNASAPDPAAPVSVDEAMSEADVLAQTESGLDEAGLIDARALRIGTTDVERAVTPAAWAAIAGLIGEFTFESLCRQIGRGGAVTTLRELRSLGLLEAAFESTPELDLSARPAPQPAAGDEQSDGAGLEALVAAAARTREADGTGSATAVLDPDRTAAGHPA